VTSQVSARGRSSLATCFCRMWSCRRCAWVAARGDRQTCDPLQDRGAPFKEEGILTRMPSSEGQLLPLVEIEEVDGESSRNRRRCRP
jgi:hypothetical protein